MNYQEIVKELKKQEITTNNLMDDELDNPLPVIGNWKSVDSYGGEGQGDTLYNVIHFTEHNVFMKISGWYSSYSGGDVDDDYASACKEVAPEQKTITVYNG